MSDSEFDSNGGLGAARKAPAVEATVPPTAGEIVAELRARALQAKSDAEKDLDDALYFKTGQAEQRFRGRCSAFDEVLQWLDDVSGCDASST